jgi:hypothetical protein
LGASEYAIASIRAHRQDTSAQVAISWVVMPTPALATQYKHMVDERYRGNPPGESAAFNGLCYASGQNGETVWVDQVQPTGHINADQEILQVMAPTKLSPSYLDIHCVS